MKGEPVRLSALLERNLEPLAPYLKTAGLVELCVNAPGEVMLETHDGWLHKRSPELDRKTLLHLARVLATASGQTFSEEVPLLSCFLPSYGYRVQIISGAMVDSGFAMAVRVGTARAFSLDSYFNKAADAKVRPHRPKARVVSIGGAALLAAAVRQRKNILVSGGTGSGKTTLLNTLIRLIEPETRIITVEDTKELIVEQSNSVRILKSKTGTDVAKISYRDIINACMRLRPDRILVGELDVENTVPFLRLINTGHAGSMTTVHADSPAEAIDAICMNAQLAGLQGNAEAIERYARQSLDVVVQLERVSRSEFRANVEYHD